MRKFGLFAIAASLVSTFTYAGNNLVSARAVIEGQIVAFLNDDVDSAYSFATPRIQRIFPEPRHFVEMIKRDFAPVHRPGNYAFGRALSETDGATIAQELLITGPEGKNWRAVYVLERQDDGKYRISDVRLSKLEGSAI